MDGQNYSGRARPAKTALVFTRRRTNFASLCAAPRSMNSPICRATSLLLHEQVVQKATAESGAPQVGSHHSDCF